ncbi:MAG: hypothetical protein K6C97_09790 [Treponema sp.]|nr:hypothetical protein [Treponema sp.]
MKTRHKKNNMIVIYRPYKVLKNGKRIYASSYGKKAFRFEIPVEKFNS